MWIPFKQCWQLFPDNVNEGPDFICLVAETGVWRLINLDELIYGEEGGAVEIWEDVCIDSLRICAKLHRSG